MFIEQLISSYGYIAIGIGTFFEGETILVMAGFAAHRGYLELHWVILSAMVGTFFGDQLYFYTGRTKGTGYLENRPYWKAKSAKVLRLIEKNQILLILGFRFLYGVRTVTPFLIGASKIAPSRFLLLNSFSASVWAIAIGTLGYLFGYTLENMITEIKHYELLTLAVLAAVGIGIWSVHVISKRRTISRYSHPADAE